MCETTHASHNACSLRETTQASRGLHSMLEVAGKSDGETATLFMTCAVTMLVAAGFVIGKNTYDVFRQRLSHVTVVVVGAGPVGLTAALIAARSGKAPRIIVYEERSRADLIGRAYQMSLSATNIGFLHSLGVDFDNIEGCREQGCFFTPIGVFLEYMLSILERIDTSLIEIRLGKKFTKESLKELDTISERLVVIVCDGFKGRSASLLGLSDEFIHHSCRTYGAVATIERNEERLVPTSEIRIHNVTFDLRAYGHYIVESPTPRFHVKIFGSVRHRFIALAVSREESRFLKMLKVSLDQSIMRNIFQCCYNAFKSDSESCISDTTALRYMKFSPRLFEIKLLQRMESVAFIEDANLFVMAEGESARCCNFLSGMNVNLALKGLHSLRQFIRMAASAGSEKSITQALQFQMERAQSTSQDFLRTGLRDSMRR